jgi:DNA-binding NarL/FixJ family response regulator
MRIVIVDANGAFRRDLALYLPMLDADYRVVGEAATAQESLQCIAALLPDIVVADIDLPDCNGLIAMRQVLQSWPDMSILMIGNYPQLDYRRAALRAGTLDYIDKLDLIHALPTALAAVAHRPATPLPGPPGAVQSEAG